MKAKDEQYSEEETERRFMAAVKAALNTPPKRMKDIPRKWSGAKRKQRKKVKNVAA